ncbi:hypothetical protein [Spirillospora sp. CA-294931]|uniref:hypothetical protein n=1 Tax=Spirillospora sp. CA-294931 TaxID=3240042 RepID=UPI003D929999
MSDLRPGAAPGRLGVLSGAPELGRVLRLDARRTALLVVVPLLTAVGVVTAWLSLVPGVAYWDNSVVALLDTVRLLGPVAAGLAAWAALRERRLHYLHDLSARSPATGVLLGLLLLGGAALVAYGAVTAVVVVETVLRNEAGRPSPLGLAAGAAALTQHVVLGYLAARLAPRPATVVLVVVATWLWAVARVPGTSWWSLLPPAALNQVELFTGLRPRVLADETAWSLAFTAALVLAYVYWVTRRRRLLLPLLLALLVTGAVTVRLESSEGRAVTPAAFSPACRNWPLTVCVHPALRPALPGLMTATMPLATRLNGTPGEFTRVMHRPESEPPAVRHGVAVVHLDEDLSPGFEAQAVRQIRDSLLDRDACNASRGGSGAAYERLVGAWLVGEHPPPIADAGAARRFGAWSEDRRKNWLRTHYAEFRTCALDPADFRPVKHVKHVKRVEHVKHARKKAGRGRSPA